MQSDVLVIGAGISGVSVAYELAASMSVIVAEAETAAGYHSTGRSAALYTPNYGIALVRQINRASHAFLAKPPDGFSAHPLLTPRGQLTIAAPGDETSLNAVLALSTPGQEIRPLSASEALAMAPVLRPERTAAAAFEPGVMDMDVAALHQGYLNGMKQRGAVLLAGQRIEHLERRGGLWRATAGEITICSRIVVNAAGAWADQVGKLCNVKTIGIVPKRRTAIVVEAPENAAVAAMPAVDFAGRSEYLKPAGGRIMASPGDQTPLEPQDIQPDDYEIAVFVDWLETETRIKVRRITTSWAGLRSFVADEAPVAGFAADVDGFFWLAGQGGYGIMMAPALAQAATAIITTGSLPDALRDAGITLASLNPARLAESAET